ncbi:hypothetical protein CERZMDRAFT_103404 [Cercospora zeae-maydis SCOH1-5]|uniref:Uncharacterized protein n=1 Tax=Cercospora zeae-maydis SCOH1-5 TaxID=717836 RepID=A0A6A6F241_9PEZI|nr:hypothetical protein CERZMDRAFT_103404 [Cercospora zeae-maydis SCOH1-5]
MATQITDSAQPQVAFVGTLQQIFSICDDVASSSTAFRPVDGPHENTALQPSDFDPSPLPIAHAPGQEIFDEAYISSDGWKFDVGAQVEQLFDPSASTDGLWDADLIAVNIPSSKCNTVKSMSRWH